MEIQLTVTIDYIRLRSKLNNRQFLIFTKKSFFYTILCFIPSDIVPLNNSPSGYIRILPRTYICEKPISITGVVKVLLKCDCTFGNIVDGIREPTLYSFALDKPPGQKINKIIGNKLLKKDKKIYFISYTISIRKY